MICEPICVRCLSSATHSSLVCILIHLASYLSIYLSIYLSTYLFIYVVYVYSTVFQTFLYSPFRVDMQEYTLCTTRGQIKLKKESPRKIAQDSCRGSPVNSAGNSMSPHLAESPGSACALYLMA